jgi:hypothetical protein
LRKREGKEREKEDARGEDEREKGRGECQRY